MKKWTHEERQKLRNEYSQKPVKQIAQELNTSENSVRKQVQYLRKRGWTFWELILDTCDSKKHFVDWKITEKKCAKSVWIDSITKSQINEEMKSSQDFVAEKRKEFRKKLIQEQDGKLMTENFVMFESTNHNFTFSKK